MNLCKHPRRVGALIGAGVCMAASLLGAPANAQVVSPGAIVVKVTAQSGSVQLPGVTVAIESSDHRVQDTGVSDEDGRVRLADLPPGLYQVRASLSGFDEVARPVRVVSRQDAVVELDLPLSGLVERVNVIGNAETATPTIGETLSTRGVLQSRVIEQLPIQDHSVLSALKLLAGILEGPGGLSIKGGRNNQSGLQIGMASLTDASTGSPLFRLPADAIDSVEVLPNPYAVEFGRFSSGLTLINTKSGSDKWQVGWNTPDISLRVSRSQQWKPTGIDGFGPRAGVGGPIVKNRVFLAQSVQMRYESSEVWSRPENERKINKWFSSFTRLDTRLTPRHSVIGTFNFFPSRSDNLTLGTFNGPDVAASQKDRLFTGGVAAHSIITDGLLLDSTVQAGDFQIDVAGHGTGPMKLIPAQNEGSFFNRQHRNSSTVQWVETLVASRNWRGVPQLLKAGVDVMRTTFFGISRSAPVQILREDRTLARELTFVGPITQNVRSLDFAVFAQDRMQIHRRLLLEAGGRADRDGVLGRTTATPRIGAVWMMDEQGSSVLRGGFGLFFERTPSVVGAFNQFETAIDTRYGADGVTPSAPSVVQDHVTAPDLDVARSTTWNLEWDKRVNTALSFRASVLSRQGMHELLATPVAASQSRVELRLSSDGRSSYREGELTARYQPSDSFEVSGTYVRSSAYSNLNAYTAFFNNVRWPVISADAYAPVSSNAPNRLITHSRVVFGGRWLVSSILELHNGFPFSATDEMLDWVGTRNVGYHFPLLAALDLDVEHRFTSIKGKPWIGFRAYNALNRFAPSEVQANLGSSDFGTFYNSAGRQIRFQLRF